MNMSFEGAKIGLFFGFYGEKRRPVFVKNETITNFARQKPHLMDHPRLTTTTPYPDETYERLKYRRINHGILAETGPERIGNGFYVLL